MNTTNIKLLPCPFCGFIPDRNDADCIYPASKPEYDSQHDRLIYKIWQIVCYETGGGCSATILGDSPDDVINKWNTRTS